MVEFVDCSKDNKEKEGAVKLLMRSCLNKGKYYITTLIIMTVVVAMTIFKSDIAYNLALFASPLLVIIVWAVYIAAKAGGIEVSEEKGLPKSYITAFYLTGTGLLAGFGHWWLATCWLFIWIGAWLNHQLRDEKLKEMETEA